METQVFTFIDIVGTAAFSISGVIAAMEKKLDIFGVLVIAFITAIGGGTLRDVMIGDLPVSWMRTSNYSIVIFLSAAAAIFFYRVINNYEKVLLVFDALGLGFFTLVGIHKGIDFGFTPGLCIAIGTITACFGGMIRDIVLNHIPRLFQKEIYATACIAGGLLYFLLRKLIEQEIILDAACIAFIVIIRLVAVRFNVSLPRIQRGRDQ